MEVDGKRLTLEAQFSSHRNERRSVRFRFSQREPSTQLFDIGIKAQTRS